MKTATESRYYALDVLRGMTIAGMILVNNPGTWSKIFSPLRHAQWHGCTPTDLVFPFFLFIVGTALFFSFSKYESSSNASSSLNRSSSLNTSSVKKIIKRGSLIFLTGLLLNAFPFYPTSPDPSLDFGANYLEYLHNLRIFGVLQRIALCYMLGGVLALWLKKPGKIIAAGVVLMALHLIILAAFGTNDPFSLEGNIAGRIDAALLGESHVYKGFGVPFDPEGLLGVLSGSATVLCGYLAGLVIRRGKDKSDSVITLYTAGLLALGAGVVLSIFIPINKPLWTPSYVLYAGGWAALMLAFFIYFIDIRGKERLFYPFKALGVNPLFAFVMAGVFAKLLGRVIKWSSVITLEDGSVKDVTTSASSWFYHNVCAALLGDNQFGSLLYALIYVFLFTAMAIYLYRKKIIIKL